jgi:hypothetical protein
MTASAEPATTPPSRRARLLRRARRAACWIAVFYLLVMLFGRPADRLLLIPQKSAERVRDATRHMLPYDGGSLDWLATKSTAPGGAVAPR